MFGCIHVTKKKKLFKKVMLMAFHNLVIIQNKDMMRYAIIHEGRHLPQVP
jgi:hypothetical protein